MDFDEWVERKRRDTIVELYVLLEYSRSANCLLSFFLSYLNNEFNWVKCEENGWLLFEKLGDQYCHPTENLTLFSRGRHMQRFTQFSCHQLIIM